MKQLQLTILTVFLLVVGISTAACQSSIIDSITQTHIDNDVPDEKDFDSFLKRDLAKYFKKTTGQDVVVEYELLRKEPTESGTSFPKFYAWIKIKEQAVIIEEGAVRISAVEKEKFEITHYLEQAEIERDEKRIYQIFPKPIADKIRAKINR